MPTKGGKKAKGEGNISEDDGVGQATDAPTIRYDLTPTMPAFAQGERSPPTVSDNFGAAFITSGVARAAGNISPDFRRDNELSLPEQLALAIHEQRFEDAKRLKAVMIAEQDLEQQLALAVKDERFDDCIRFRDAIIAIAIAKARDGQGQTKTPNRLKEQSAAISNDATMLSQQSDLKKKLVLAIKAKRSLDAAHFRDAISQSVEEQMPATNLPPSHINMEPALHTAFGSALEISDDTISAAPRLMEAAATLAAAKQDNVGNEMHDNMGKGETFGHDYDM
jgi:hypothetical protein